MSNHVSPSINAQASPSTGPVSLDNSSEGRLSHDSLQSDRTAVADSFPLRDLSGSVSRPSISQRDSSFATPTHGDLAQLSDGHESKPVATTWNIQSYNEISPHRLARMRTSCGRTALYVQKFMSILSADRSLEIRLYAKRSMLSSLLEKRLSAKISILSSLFFLSPKSKFILIHPLANAHPLQE